MPRTPRLEGIASRVGADGVTYYRGTAYVHGEARRGPWSTDPEQAIAWRARTLRDATDGFLVGRRMTLGDAIDDFTEGIAEGYYRNKKDGAYKPGVVRLYTRKLELSRQHFGAKTALDTLRVHDVAQFKKAMRRKGRSDSYIRQTIVALRSLYAWAIPCGLAVINPCAGIPLPTGRSRKVIDICPPERASLLTSCLVGRDRTAFALAWLAGLRAGELLPITWTQIDLEERSIEVETAIDTFNRAEIGTKTIAGNRTIPIRSRLLVILEDHAEIYGSVGRLFPAYRGSVGRTKDELPESYSGLVQRLTRRWGAAGLEPLGLHAARHTFVSTLIDADCTPKQVMTYAGHSSINVTYDLYGHLFPDDHEDTLRRLDDYDERG